LTVAGLPIMGEPFSFFYEFISIKWQQFTFIPYIEFIKNVDEKAGLPVVGELFHANANAFDARDNTQDLKVSFQF